MKENEAVEIRRRNLLFMILGSERTASVSLRRLLDCDALRPSRHRNGLLPNDLGSEFVMAARVKWFNSRCLNKLIRVDG